ncbi:MAG: nucleotide 5'-monophosphate nucleosidase PpnN [Wenzhouxiangellaceae bacterium]
MQAVSTQVYPAGILNILSSEEVNRLHDASRGELHQLLRSCALAVLNSGSQIDNAEQMLEAYQDFSIDAVPVTRGIRLDVRNAPATAFVDGKMIRGIKELLSAVVRDLVYFHTEIAANPNHDMASSDGITNVVFEILRNAGLFKSQNDPNLVVCWGGHSIPDYEYIYTKEVGYEMGLRGLDICTGCGPGAMKGPMKGAAIGHAKQRLMPGRYVGISEPGIIAAEAPNPIVNELVITPDIEKRLEAFVRTGHGIIVFPGGVGTAEEILFLLGVLLHPDNQDIPFPLVFTGPSASADYFRRIDEFLRFTIGDEVARYYQIIIDDPAEVARVMRAGVDHVREFRTQSNDAYYFNWKLTIEDAFQQPFKPCHENMAGLELDRTLPKHELAANLRRAFSGIVAGNVKADGLVAIRAHGPFEIHGEVALMKALDELLQQFVAQGRMKLPGTRYEPCYRVVTG